MMTDLEKPRIAMLIDGTAVAYRAYHAIPPLSTSSGIPTHAVLGFIRMLEQLERKWNPGGIFVAFDGGRPEFRMLECPAYKAQRAAMPDDLRRQFPLIEEYLQAHKTPFLRLEGEEADDLLATMTRTSLHEGADEVLIATGDKDFFQLVSDRVAIVPVHKSEGKIGPAEVFRRTGVPPARIVEWLALVGDTADNLPGVPGVGPKTAAVLLDRFASLEDLWLHIDDISPEKTRAALRQHRPVVERNVRMMTLRSDLPCPEHWFPPEDRRKDVARLRDLYRRLELYSLLKEISEPTLFS